jgi:hypothetical protein
VRHSVQYRYIFSLRRPITRSEDSYRVWWVWVRSRSLERGGHDPKTGQSATGNKQKKAEIRRLYFFTMLGILVKLLLFLLPTAVLCVERTHRVRRTLLFLFTGVAIGRVVTLAHVHWCREFRQGKWTCFYERTNFYVTKTFSHYLSIS